MKTKNKTTHKHNYKLIDSTRKVDEFGFTWVLERYSCCCGDWKATYHNTTWDWLVLPPDLNRVNKPTREYKIING